MVHQCFVLGAGKSGVRARLQLLSAEFGDLNVGAEPIDVSEQNDVDLLFGLEREIEMYPACS